MERSVLSSYRGIDTKSNGIADVVDRISRHNRVEINHTHRGLIKGDVVEFGIFDGKHLEKNLCESEMFL